MPSSKWTLMCEYEVLFKERKHASLPPLLSCATAGTGYGNFNSMRMKNQSMVDDRAYGASSPSLYDTSSTETDENNDTSEEVMSHTVTSRSSCQSDEFGDENQMLDAQKQNCTSGLDLLALAASHALCGLNNEEEKDFQQLKPLERSFESQNSQKKSREVSTHHEYLSLPSKGNLKGLHTDLRHDRMAVSPRMTSRGYERAIRLPNRHMRSHEINCPSKDPIHERIFAVTPKRIHPHFRSDDLGQNGYRDSFSMRKLRSGRVIYASDDLGKEKKMYPQDNRNLNNSEYCMSDDFVHGKDEVSLKRRLRNHDGHETLVSLPKKTIITRSDASEHGKVFCPPSRNHKNDFNYQKLHDLQNENGNDFHTGDLKKQAQTVSESWCHIYCPDEEYSCFTPNERILRVLPRSRLQNDQNAQFFQDVEGQVSKLKVWGC